MGKKLLATGNGRCNLDNTAIAPEKYFTADPAALRPLLAAVDAAAPLAWFEQLGLYTRTDEAAGYGSTDTSFIKRYEIFRACH